MLFRTFVLPAIAATSLLSINANAALDANQTFQQFNAVVFGDINSNSRVHGRTWVGGNVNGGGYAQDELITSNYAGLTVMGNANNGIVLNGGAVVKGNLNGLGVNNGGAAILGDAKDAHFNGGAAYVKGTSTNIGFNGGKLDTPDANLQTKLDAADSTNFYNVLNHTSDSLSKLASTSNASLSWNDQTATFNVTADGNGLAVFNLSDANASTIFALGQFDFNLNGASTVIINAGLKDIDIWANFVGGSAQHIASQVIWNFYNSETIDLASQFGGSILATDAHLTNWADIEGNVFVNNLTQHGQIHQFGFTGDLSSVVAVPEPSTYAMFLAGLGLLAFGARRRA